MSKNLLFIVCVVLLIIACQSSETQQFEKQIATSLSIAEFNSNPKEYVGQILTVSGTVDHVCKHGGKKMFIMGDDPEQRLKINTTDAVGPFMLELEGSDVTVEGLVQVMKIDEKYLNEWEAETRAEHEKLKTEENLADSANCAEETGKDEHKSNLDETLERINSLRQELAESGEEYLGYYSLECQSYEEKN